MFPYINRLLRANWLLASIYPSVCGDRPFNVGSETESDHEGVVKAWDTTVERITVLHIYLIMIVSDWPKISHFCS